jgi:hypothetical protein
VQVSAIVNARSRAGFALSRFEVAMPELPAPSATGLDFRPVDLGGDAADHVSSWSKTLESAAATSLESGLQFSGKAAVAQDRSYYGGLRLALPGADAVRLRMSFLHGEDIKAVYVDAYTASKTRRARWLWTCRPYSRPPAEADTFLFVPGQNVAFFHADAAASLGDARELHVFLHIAPGKTAGMVLHSAEVGHLSSGRTVGESRWWMNQGAVILQEYAEKLHPGCQYSHPRSEFDLSVRG